jgi:hypothetical protein
MTYPSKRLVSHNIILLKDAPYHYLVCCKAAHQPDGVHLSAYCTCGVKLEGVGNYDSIAVEAL